MENYEKKYKDALERAKEIVNDQNASSVWKGWLCNCFPELKKNEDEKIRKWILGVLSTYEHDKNLRDAAIAWLKKQAEQKLVDNVKPRFKVGDWITNGATNPVQISSIKDGIYFTHNDTIGGDIESIDKEYHLWDIKDAKDGDVLIYNHQPFKWIFIFKRLYSPIIILYYVMFTEKNKIYIDDSISTNFLSKITPATKEQCDLLFKKMKEAGYEWDVEKKELKKIENEIEIPFGAKDSELQETTYYIPKGFYSVLDGNKVIIKKGEQKPAWSEEDERIKERLIRLCTQYMIPDGVAITCENWLKSLKQRIGG